MIKMNILTFGIEGDLRECLSLLEIKSDFAIILLQKYRLCEGTDVVVWHRAQDGNTYRTVYATGPIRRKITDVEFLNIEKGNDPDIPRSQRIARALEKVEMQPDGNWLEDFAAENNALHASTDIVAASEFTHVKKQIENLSLGCRDVLGVDSTLFCGIVRENSVEVENRSWGGTIDASIYWQSMNEILEIAKISDLPIWEYQK